MQGSVNRYYCITLSLVCRLKSTDPTGYMLMFGKIHFFTLELILLGGGVHTGTDSSPRGLIS